MSATGTATERIGWVDTGRGIAILLVALFHSANWLLGAGFDIPYWREINEALSSMRMPLFFVLSGLFAPKWLLKPWRDLWTVKVRLYLWVFLLWEVIGSIVFLLGQTMKGEGFGLRDAVLGLAVSPILPRFELWFIWALSIFFVVAKLSRRVDPRLQLVVAGAVSIVALSGLETANVGWSGSLKYYFFFLAGIYLRNWIIRIGTVDNTLLVGAAMVLWVAVTAAIALLGLRDVFGLYFVNCLVGVVGGIAFSRTLRGVRWFGAIGRITLPIYLAHTPIVILISFVLSLPVIFPAVAVIAPVLPPILALAAVLLALALHRYAMRSWLRYAYEPPPFITELDARPGRLRAVRPGEEPT
ncbi:acyltransferase family protein [Cryobacterium sp. PH29-G1]|uniref:acyltransferase family protein n=1 Tax=Cryobacterium sp. PH29-G1 TaxID=3046211 RepID=UPI0024B9F880|nr:acyltransferase family protein [Cryobacterium sp. PH29-G1]MDJ0349990.1 acyltransferase family protein [Cryobacterium sp. PH29-G1]